jgi:hypothetical protein
VGIRQDRELVRALCDIDRGLTDWEVAFIEGIAHQVIDQRQQLTPRQLKSALQIHDRMGRSKPTEPEDDDLV